MRTPSKIITALALAGIAVAGGAAFTATGLTQTATTQFVGGQVTQTVTGANLSTVTYHFLDEETKVAVTSISLTLVDKGTGAPLSDKLVTVTAADGGSGTFSVDNGPLGVYTATYSDASAGDVGITGITVGVTNPS